MWEPDEGSGVHRTASARRDRRDPARAPERSDGRWPVALVKSKSAADWLPAGWFGLCERSQQRDRRNDVRGHGHLRGQFLKTATYRPGHPSAPLKVEAPFAGQSRDGRSYFSAAAAPCSIPRPCFLYIPNRNQISYHSFKNPSITIGSSTVSYDGTLRAGQELQIGPGTEARLMPSNLVVGDLEVLRDPAGPHGAKAWSDKEEVASLRVMNPSKPGAKIRIKLSGKVAGGAQSMIRLAGYKLPASYHAWTGEPLLVNALTEHWQDEVSVDITLPPEADIRQVLLYRHGNQGTVWYGSLSVTPVDIPAEGIDVSDRVQGALATIVPGMPEPPSRRSLVLLPTAPTVVEGEPSSPVRFVYSDQSEPSGGLPRMQVQVMQLDE
jgi:hypothetical protein